MSFPRTARLIALDGFAGWSVRAAAVGALLAAWLAWFVGARVGVYELSESARLESVAFVHPVESPVRGRITAVHGRLGDLVDSGDVLFDVDPQKQRQDLTEAEGRLASQRAQIDAIRKELATEDSLRAREDQSAAEQLEEAAARAREAAVAVRLARNEVERGEQLKPHGLISDVDLMRARAEVERRQALAEALEAAAARIAAEHEAQRTRSAARSAHLVHELTVNEGERASLLARLDGLRRELDDRQIRAPIAGRIARLADREVGAVVEEGDRLAEIVPPGNVRAVAHFAPSAVGRLRPGQPARVRLDAFPWVQFGVLQGQVEQVATETQDGRIEAQLALYLSPHGRIPEQHGLVGRAEVEVERVSPATLVWRAAGGFLDGGAGDRR